MNNISAVISARNEEAKIAQCLRSLDGLVADIIVVDNESTDKTVRIAEQFGAKIYRRKNNVMLNINKNYGFTKVRTPWIINLDADEEVSPELKQEILQLELNDTSIVGYWIPRRNIIFKKVIKHGLWSPDKQLRLFYKDAGKFEEKNVHEYISVKGSTASLVQPIIHHNYESISQYLTKLNTIYTESDAASSLNDIVTWESFVLEPVRDMVKIYYAQGGYKDGNHGVVLSILQGIYTFATLAKRWEKEGFPQKAVSQEKIRYLVDELYREIRFWEYEIRIREATPLGRIMLKVARRLSL